MRGALLIACATARLSARRPRGTCATCRRALRRRATQQVLKYKTDQLQDLKRLEKLNNLMFTLMALLYPAMLITGVHASSQQLLKPIKSGTKQVGVVFIQGAQIPPEAYIPLAKRIQSESILSIYVVIPAFALNTPEPLVLSGGIEKGIQSMHDAGLDKEADIVLMGHSLGGAMLQDYVFKCK
mgnify:CR=1 FL=1